MAPIQHDRSRPALSLYRYGSTIPRPDMMARLAKGAAAETVHHEPFFERLRQKHGAGAESKRRPRVRSGQGGEDAKDVFG